MLFTILVGMPCWEYENMNLLSLLCLSLLYRAGNGRVHGPSAEVIGDMEQLRLLKWSVSRNGVSLYPLQWRGSCNKCRKKVVKIEGVFCGNFYVGRGQYLPC